jgi:hypothetical protein
MYAFQGYLTRSLPNGKTETTWIVRHANDYSQARQAFRQDFPQWQVVRIVNYCSCPMA